MALHSSDRQQTGQTASQLLSYQQLDILHVLRGFCAFYVVIFHAKYLLWSGGNVYLQHFPRAGWSIWQYGAFALDMSSAAGFEMVVFFFVLSGFFIRYAQLRKPRKALAFYKNRLVRIYPPYLASVAVACLALALVCTVWPQVLGKAGSRELNIDLRLAWEELNQFDGWSALRTLAFLKVGALYLGYNKVYWSLLIEAIFYLFVPLFFWRIRQYYILSTVLYLAGLAGLSQYAGLNPLLDYFITYNFFFAAGAFLHDVVGQTAWLERVKQIPGAALAAGCLVLFGLVLILTLSRYLQWSGLAAAFLAVLAVSALLAGRVKRDNWVIAGLYQLGVFSFSLYLYHFPLLLLCYGLLVGLTGETLFYVRYYWLAILLVTAFCYVLYLVTERPAIKYFRKV